MIVAVQKELSKIIPELKKDGFEAVIYGEYNYPVDALVYTKSGISDFSKTHMADGKKQGVFMLNAENKDTKDIVKMLNHRLYEPIF